MFNQYSQFYKPKATEQKPNEVVDVTEWSIGDKNIYPEGAREKFDVESPKNIVSSYNFLISNHKYLFKRPYTEKSGTVLYDQFWTEIIAYKLGRILGIPVPPAFVGHYKEDSELVYGALIEWFYDYKESKDIKDTSQNGGDIISRYIDNYDRKKGKQHNFKTIAEICAEYKIDGWLREWTNILLFDALIANRDRHQNNWEIIRYANDTQHYLSPAFDNGTSMGYNFRPEHMTKLNLDNHVQNGTHHMKFALSDDKKAGFVELLKKIVYNFPETKAYIEAKLSVDISGIAQDICELCEFNIHDDKYRLTTERASFIIKIIMFRYNWLRKEFNL